ncbi:filamentous hemagglutinin N-terminal domain-containing protein [Arsenophonus sp. aPb]|uniref:two-partner secretion domain-containing protein n=1 Tax=Arsenophonus sp. aPb TaxID=3041619 RepID=UPI002468DA40|nr:filamentous hemagglutinin N-terminal domain-containing protein [Arsenophonus sp. aPb]WGL99558.1 filamentous hemagglutinin N-terminal domain-containing protein [Arsenophonus sp. aPb]
MIIIKYIFNYWLITILLLSTNSFANNKKISELSILKPTEMNIDIKAPDNNGISYNQYKQFYTLRNVITHLNNDASQNKNMLKQRTGAAKWIINEVTSNSKTKLNGVLNIKGTPAKVVIVNPNGITCNGCQFTNATAVDLIVGRLFYINKTISYHTNKGKIIFAGKGIHSDGNFTDQKNNLLAKLFVYAGQVQLKDNANIHVAEQHYAIGNYNTYHYLDFAGRAIMTGEKIATKFTIGKSSQIYANKLTIFNGEGLNLHNQGSIITHDIMNVNADHIINEGSIMAYENTDTSPLSGMYISTKHLVNHYNGRISATKGKIGFKQSYLPFGQQDKNIKITKLTY